MRLALRCGCVVQFREGGTPLCGIHGVQSVVRVLDAPAPRFTGSVTGPHATTTDVAPYVGKVS